jgi:hypothetical protein
MPELSEFREVIESYPVVVGILGFGAALLAAVITRWVDRSSLDEAEEQLVSYKDEVRRLNEARAELLFRLEERGDDLRRLKADMARMDERTTSRTEGGRW